MNPGIPQRLWYSVKETADLLGVSAQYIYDDIRRSRRTDHPIPTRTLGNRLRVHRSYLFPDEPANVTPIRSGPSPEQITEIVRQAVRETFAEIGRVTDRMVG